jgi:hypothetical protein
MRIKRYRRNGQLSGLFTKLRIKHQEKKAAKRTGQTSPMGVPSVVNQQLTEQPTAPKKENLFSQIQSAVNDVKQFAGDSGIIKQQQYSEPVQQESSNTMLYLGGAALLAFVLLKK